MIIAFDLGRHVGICHGGRDEQPQLNHVELPLELGAIMTQFEGKARGFIRRLKPDFVFWERPFVAYGRFDAQGDLRTQRLYGQSACLAKIVYEESIPWGYEKPNSIRKKILGNGNADEKDIMRFAYKNGMSPVNDHEADAFLCWKFAAGKLL